MMTNQLRVVVDTNVLIRRLLAPDSAPARAVSHAVGHGRLLASSATLEELARVLGRARFDRYLSLEDRQQFFRLLGRVIENVPILVQIDACRDPSDNKFLELALSGAASVIVTGDREHKKYKHPILRIPEVSRAAPMRRLIPVATRNGSDFAQFSPVVANRTTKHAKLPVIGLFRHERLWTTFG